MGCEWLKNETLLFQGVLVKQYHASLSNLRPEGSTRIPRHFMRVRKTMRVNIISYVIIIFHISAHPFGSVVNTERKKPDGIMTGQTQKG